VKILLTGSSGFLGSNIYQEISSTHQIFSLSRNAKDFTFDLSTEVPFFNDTKFDVVIHAAGLAHVASKKNDLFQKVNVDGTYNLLKGLELSGIPDKFVFISSVAVYSEMVGALINENSSLKATDHYGRSKIEAEQLVINWCKKYNVTYTIFRLPLVVGKNAPGNLGTMMKGISRGFYFNIGGGTSRKSMVLASDVGKFIIKAAEVGGVYNLTDGHHPSFYDLSIRIANCLGKKKPKNIPVWSAKILAKVGDLIGNRAPINSLKLLKIRSELTFDDRRARNAFGWNPKPVLSNMLF